MKGSVGIDLQEAYESLQKELLSEQNANNIDGVSGATISSDVFRKLAKKIMNEQVVKQ